MTEAVAVPQSPERWSVDKADLAYWKFAHEPTKTSEAGNAVCRCGFLWPCPVARLVRRVEELLAFARYSDGMVSALYTQGQRIRDSLGIPPGELPPGISSTKIPSGVGEG